MWSEQDLNFQPRFSSFRRQPLVLFSVNQTIPANISRAREPTLAHTV
jgi:hypothetical protein